LASDKKLLGVADQLYRAIGSVAANIAEGYSHRSGRNQARFYEYALGSAREARGWYYQGRHLLGETVTAHRLQLLTEIIRQLLAIIPAQRGSRIKEGSVSYEAVSSTLLDDPPMP
jgi:four helix bundle protein